MKKTLSILLALALAILLAFPAFAVEMVNESFEYAFDTLPAKYDDATYISLGELWVDGATNANHNTGGGNRQRIRLHLSERQRQGRLRRYLLG